MKKTAEQEVKPELRYRQHHRPQSADLWPSDMPRPRSKSVAGCRAVHQERDGSFPRSGCEHLLGQIFNLGVESHDDLCDGLTTLLQGLVEQGVELPRIHRIET